MEILSTGEKIKRARIYKGLTLKDVCGDKISVSKLSCIENDKIAADDFILKHVSKKLQIDFSYLKQNVREQIENNIKYIKHSKVMSEEEYEKNLKISLNIAEKNKYYDLAFEIMHILFNYYIRSRKNDNLTIITTQYYYLCEKTATTGNQMVYYKDMARYLYLHKEFLQAASYYHNVRKCYNSKNKDCNYIEVIYNEAACYIMLGDYEQAYEIAVKLVDLIDYIADEIKIAEVYHMLAALSLRMRKDEFEQYEKLSYKYFKEDLSKKAEAMYNYASVMFELELKDKAKEYIIECLNIYPKDNLLSSVNFLLLIIQTLVKNEILDIAEDLCEKALNDAIALDKVILVERAYYFKAKVLFKKGNYDMCETYLNLSLDFLGKYAKRDDMYKRYLEIAGMYHEMGNSREALKYFTLVINAQKRL